MEKEKAIELLKDLIEKVKKIPLCHVEQREQFHLDGRAVLGRVFGKDSRQLKDFDDVRWTPGAYTRDQDRQKELDIKGHQKGQQRSLVILSSALNEVEQFWELDHKTHAIDPIRILERLCEKFHLVVRQLRDRHAGRSTLDVTDEYDVQDLIHALLVLDFDDVRAEEWTPSYAGASSRMDFLLKQVQLVLEVKRTRKGLGAKEVGEQLIVDCQRYRSHPDCKMLVCFVYDPEGLVANPRGVEHDLSTAGGELLVKVYVRP